MSTAPISPNSRRAVMQQVAAAAGLTALGALTTALPGEATPLAAPTGQLVGKKAVVTGAARGIGRAIAVLFAHEGADVLGIDIAGPASSTTQYPAASRADLDETARLVRATGRKFIPVVADTRDRAAVQAAAQQAVKELGQVDILVANAGIQVFTPLLDMDDAHWDDVIHTNLTGTFNTVRAFGKVMAPRQQGRIIITASTQGKKGLRSGSSYSASKWGLIGFMKSAALDLGKYQITVNCLVPGLIDTLMTRNERRWTEGVKDYVPNPPVPVTEQEAAKVLSEHNPLHLPWLRPEDMAPVVVFLASEAGARITGATFDVDGGASAQLTA